VYQASVRLGRVDTLIICVTNLYLFRLMSDKNGYVLPESTLHSDALPNRGTQLERPLLDSAVHVFGRWSS